MSVSDGAAACLRRGIRFQRYVKYKAKLEGNFGGGEKRIRFRGKVGGMEAGVLAAKGGTTPPLDARLRGQDGWEVGGMPPTPRV